MLSWNQLLGEPELEIRLLRKGHDTRVAAELHCADCGRVPLTGEQVFEFDDGSVCTLCRTKHGGSPRATAPVDHVEHGISVRRLTLPRAA
ncbi:MAG: hypothetical protein NTZ58_01645 [Solirubrobacterales bacterium]|nr:hypothetical protein [Solirubrobacterales bacterium]